MSEAAKFTPGPDEIAEARDRLLGKSTADLVAIKRAGHDWTPAERAVLHGQRPQLTDYDAYLAERLTRGLPLGNVDRKRARAWLRRAALSKAGVA